MYCKEENTIIWIKFGDNFLPRKTLNILNNLNLDIIDL